MKTMGLASSMWAAMAMSFAFAEPPPIGDWLLYSGGAPTPRHRSPGDRAHKRWKRARGK